MAALAIAIATVVVTALTFIFACLTFSRDSLKLLWSSETTYEEKRNRLGEKAETLESRKTYVERQKKEAKERGESINEPVDDWITRSTNLLNDYQTWVRESSDGTRNRGGQRQTTSSGDHIINLPEVRPKDSWWSNFREVLTKAREVNQLDSRFKAILGESTINPVSDKRPPTPATDSELATWIANDDDFTVFSSTKTGLNAVMGALRDSDVRLIGVHGLPGVGKTTMVNRVVSLAMKEGLFNRLVPLTITRSPDLEDLRKTVAENFGHTFAANDSPKAQARWILEKIKEDKVLIVLDDLWDGLALGLVGLPCGTDLKNSGSKIVVTTRRDQVCSKMSCEKTIRLNICSPQEAREFFKRKAGNSLEFEDIADSVADQCQGLPLALVAVAMALKNETKEEWESALDRLKNSERVNFEGKDIVFECIWLSYDKLTPEQKACFLLCCLFPEDHNIAAEDLARYCFGLGLFPEASTVNKARQDTITIAKEVRASGLLLDAGNHKVKMHDVIRDVAIQITSRNLNCNRLRYDKDKDDRQVFLVQTRIHDPQEWPLRDSYGMYTAISAISNAIKTLPDSPDCTRLRTLLLQDNKYLCNIADGFFKQMKSLELLDLSRTQAPSLPLPTGSLEMMRVLHLDRCKFTDVSWLGSLKKLVILSLRESIIEELPESIKDLNDLRILDLTLSLEMRRIPPNVLSQLEHLEELYLKGSFAKWHDRIDHGTSGNACFAELINLPRLTVLEVDIADAKYLQALDKENTPNWVKFEICICRDQGTRRRNVQSSTWNDLCSRTLLLDSSLKDLPAWFLNAVSKKTEKLTYVDSRNVDMLEEQGRECLANLKYLMFEKFNSVTHFIRSMPCDTKDLAVFKSLQELHIFDSAIEDICEGELPEDSLKNLKFLTVKFCLKMVNSVLPQTLMKRLCKLKILHVKTTKVREVFASDDTEPQKYLGTLEEMRLVDLFKLEKIWKGPASFANFSNLKRVSVIKCDKLSHVFSVSVLGSLTQLEDLWVEECKLMVEVIGVDDEMRPESTSTLPSLKSLCLSKLPKFESVNLNCPKLEYLHVHECPLYQIPTSNEYTMQKIQLNDGHHMKTLKKRMTPEYS